MQLFATSRASLPPERKPVHGPKTACPQLQRLHNKSLNSAMLFFSSISTRPLPKTDSTLSQTISYEGLLEMLFTTSLKPAGWLICPRQHCSPQTGTLQSLVYNFSQLSCAIVHSHMPQSLHSPFDKTDIRRPSITKRSCRLQKILFCVAKSLI